MVKIRKDIINEVIDRLKNYLNFKRDGQLAEFLGMTQANLTNWRTRGTMDVFLIMEKTDINLEYLLRGNAAGGKDSYSSELEKDIEAMRDEILSLTAANSQLEVINRALVNEIMRLEQGR